MSTHNDETHMVTPPSCGTDSDTTLAAEGNIIDVEAFKYADTIKQHNKSVAACQGYAVTFPEGKSPHTAYPFALHPPMGLHREEQHDEAICAKLQWFLSGRRYLSAFVSN